MNTERAVKKRREGERKVKEREGTAEKKLSASDAERKKRGRGESGAGR